MVLCSQIAVIFCYFQISHLSFNWWWRSFYTPGSCAIYFLVYSIFFYHTKIEPRTFSNSFSIFFTTSLISSILLMMLCGSVGVFSCFIFISAVYNQRKDE
eukprot:c4221_g1_i1.p1 GENE.c4221_g1_i1~~c4221_g1_i1.p1  ORF type:complete len:100 (+),score=20.19 c4221_g1_i1:64-363(+)